MGARKKIDGSARCATVGGMINTKGSTDLDRWLHHQGRGSGKELADSLGVSMRVLTYWRRGHGVPCAEHRRGIAAYTGGAVAVESWAEVAS